MFYDLLLVPIPIPSQLTEYVEIVHPGAACRLEDVAPGNAVPGRDEKFPRIRRILPYDPVLGTNVPQHHAPLVKVRLGGGIHLVRVLVHRIQGGVVRPRTAIPIGGRRMLLQRWKLMPLFTATPGRWSLQAGTTLLLGTAAAVMVPLVLPLQKKRERKKEMSKYPSTFHTRDRASPLGQPAETRGLDYCKKV